jgi:hypothetical protein
MLAAATYLPGTYLVTYLPKYLPIYAFFCFCFCLFDFIFIFFGFFFLGQFTTEKKKNWVSGEKF